MAFITPITLPRRFLPNAYIRASILQANTNRAELLLEIWDSQAQRASLAIAPRIARRIFEDPISIPNENASDYAYRLLEAGGEFPNATWRV